MKGRGFALVWGVAFGVIGLALLGPVLSGGFFSDDWELHLAEPAKHVTRAFFESRPYQVYRPIQLLLVASSQALFGYTTLPVHLLNLALHVSLALLVMRALFAAGASRLAAVLAGAYLTVSQLAASAVGGNDTISLTLGTLAGTASLVCMDPFGARRAPRAGLALAAFALALLGKESSLGYLPVLCFLAWRHARLPLAGGFVALALGYLALRSWVGAVGPSAASGMRVGPNLFVNAALLAGVTLMPIQTTAVFRGLAEHRWLWPVVGGVSALALVGFVALGMLRAGRQFLAAGIVVAAAVVVTPVLPLQHVSELYAYALLPFAAGLFGWSAATLIAHAARPARVVAAGFAAFVLLSNAWATRADAIGMARSGALAAQLMPQVLDAVRALPSGGCLVLVDPPLEVPNYSGFQMGGFRGVQLTDRQCSEMTGRDDVRVVLMDDGRSLPLACVDLVLVTLDGERVVPFERGAP